VLSVLVLLEVFVDSLLLAPPQILLIIYEIINFYILNYFCYEREYLKKLLIDNTITLTSDTRDRYAKLELMGGEHSLMVPVAN
jgi:hypothetical protein